MSGLDDLARIFFPDSRTHRRVFVAVWVAVKYATDQFLPSLYPLCQQHGFSARVFETVRARLRKVGLLRRVTGFDPRFGYRAGWTFSGRFAVSIEKLAEVTRRWQRPAGRVSEKERDIEAMRYV